MKVKKYNTFRNKFLCQRLKFSYDSHIMRMFSNTMFIICFPQVLSPALTEFVQESHPKIKIKLNALRGIKQSFNYKRHFLLITKCLQKYCI